MSVQFKDYYEILAVTRSASDKEIKSAYRKLARKYHPDVNKDAGEKFKEINEAYEVLGDPEKRKRYDSLGAHWRHGAGFNPPPGYEQYTTGGQGAYQDMGSIFNDFGFGGGGAASGFSDFFDTLFGQMNASAQAGPRSRYSQAYGAAGPESFYEYYEPGSAQQKGGAQSLSVEQPLLLDLEEIAKGVSKSVRLAHSGKTLTVTIPKGVKPNSKIRLAGEGKSGPGGRKGDVLLIVQYKKHPLFEVDGQNLVYEVAINVPDLVLGTEITVPTLSGNVTLKIAPGTQPGRRLRLRSQGLPTKEGGAGDLLVRPKARIPEHPSEREVALYKELQSLYKN